MLALKNNFEEEIFIMGILWTIIIGFIVGLVARLIKPGNDSMGFIMTTLLGVVGALVGGYLGRVFGIYAPDEPAGFIGATVGAILVLAVVKSVMGGRRGLA